MANVKFLTGLNANLPSSNTEGQLLFAIDDASSTNGKLYLDTKAGGTLRRVLVGEPNSITASTANSTFVKSLDFYNQTTTSPKLRWTYGDDSQSDTSVPIAANGSFGFVKTTSSNSSATNLVACPIIDGVVYAPITFDSKGKIDGSMLPGYDGVYTVTNV